MGTLVYSVICSLDGYLADPSGDFSWAEPDAEVFAAVTADTERFSTYLYGRRMYETMTVWGDEAWVAQQGFDEAAFASLWQRAEKVVYSTTLDEVTTAKTRLERTFDPDAVEHLKQHAPGDLTVDGPTLAAYALRAGVVDELHMILCPTAIGGGLKVLPDGLRLSLHLLSSRRFDSGFVEVKYAID